MHFGLAYLLRLKHLFNAYALSNNFSILAFSDIWKFLFNFLKFIQSWNSKPSVFALWFYDSFLIHRTMFLSCHACLEYDSFREIVDVLENRTC